jgi:hypothetical protein
MTLPFLKTWNLTLFLCYHHLLFDKTALGIGSPSGGVWDQRSRLLYPATARQL